MVEVTQEDIRCALNHLGWDDYEEFCEWALSNHEMDRFDDLTQAFARHRIAAFNAGLEAAAKVAENIAAYHSSDQEWVINNPTARKWVADSQRETAGHIRDLKIGEE